MKINSNLSRYCESRQVLIFIKNSYGRTFRKVMLSPLSDGIKKLHDITKRISKQQAEVESNKLDGWRVTVLMRDRICFSFRGRNSWSKLEKVANILALGLIVQSRSTPLSGIMDCSRKKCRGSILTFRFSKGQEQKWWPQWALGNDPSKFSESFHLAIEGEVVQQENLVSCPPIRRNTDILISPGIMSSRITS